MGGMLPIIDAYEYNFETLNNQFTSVLILNLVDGHYDFVVYNNALGI